MAALVADGVRVEAVSPVYETAPRDLVDQPAFLNAVARVRADAEPGDLLLRVKAIERALGRTDGGPRFGPRAIDIDLLLWSGGALRTPGLELPHPRLAERRFALVPLLDLDPAAELPDGRRLADLAAALEAADQPVSPWPAGWRPPPLG